MPKNLLYSRKIVLFYLITVLILSITGTLLELIAIFNNSFQPIGITGDLFYLYVLLLESVLFTIAVVLNFQKSNKFLSYLIVGAAIAVVIAILNILIILTHLLLILSPINSTEYTFNVLIKEFSVIVIIGLLSFPLLLLFQKNKSMNI